MPERCSSIKSVDMDSDEEQEMEYADLFGWWALVITAGIAFLALVSIYLYVSSKRKVEGKGRLLAKIHRTGANLAFVWILLSLLILYIVSIYRTSAILFVSGNIVVEAALLVYLLKNRTG